MKYILIQNYVFLWFNILVIPATPMLRVLITGFHSNAIIKTGQNLPRSFSRCSISVLIMSFIAHLSRFHHSLFFLSVPPLLSFLFLLKPKGLPERCLAGHCYAPETVPRCSLQCHRSGREKNKRENENKTLWNKWKTQLCVYPLNKSSIPTAFCWEPISQRGIKTQLHLQSYISISHPGFIFCPTESKRSPDSRACVE